MLGLDLRGVTGALEDAQGLFLVALGGLVAVAGGVRAVTAAILGLEASTGIGAFVPLIGLAVSAIAGLVIGTEKGRDMMARLWAALAPLGEAFGKLWDVAEPGVTLLANLFGVALIGQINAMALAVNEVASALTIMADAAKTGQGFLGGLLAMIPGAGLLGQLGNINQALFPDKKKQGKPNDRSETGLGFGPITSASETYRRILQSPNGSGGKDWPEKAVDQQEITNEKLDKLIGKVGELQPGVVR